MFRIIFCVGVVLLMFSFLSCEDSNDLSRAENDNHPSSSTLSTASTSTSPGLSAPLILDNDERKNALWKTLYGYWQLGYQNRDIKTYMTAFASDFEGHVLGNDKILDKDEEQLYANAVFDRFETIVMEISEPVFDFADPEAPIVTSNYKVLFDSKGNGSDNYIYNGYYVKGKNIFTFKKFDENEWRILKWVDEADQNLKTKVDEYEIKNAIRNILYEYWQVGYQQKETDKYMTAFSADFEHVLDNGKTLSKVEEELNANNVFNRFETIVIELSEPAVFDLRSNPEKPTVTANYRIQFALDLKNEASDNCVYEGYYAEGKSTFTFEFNEQENEWRILKWVDESYDRNEIKQRNQ